MGDYWPLVLGVAAVWFLPALIVGYKQGASTGAGWFVGFVGLALVALFVPPLALVWLPALWWALWVPDIQHP